MSSATTSAAQTVERPPAPPPSKDESKKRVYPEEVLPDNFCCPICCLHFGKEILQCKEGHLICRPCWEKLTGGINKLCPICRCAMSNPSHCLFALQEARKPGVQLACTSVGCTYKGTYEEVCKHEQVCPVTHQPTPCLIARIVEKLSLKSKDMVFDGCFGGVSDNGSSPDAFGCAKNHRCSAATMSGKFLTCRYSGVSLQPDHTFWLKFLMHHQKRGHFLLCMKFSSSKSMFYLAFVALDRTSLPAGQRNFQIVVPKEHTPGLTDWEHGLRLEGRVITAKQVLETPPVQDEKPNPMQINIPDAVVSVHLDTLKPYLNHGNIGDPRVRMALYLRW